MTLKQWTLGDRQPLDPSLDGLSSRPWVSTTNDRKTITFYTASKEYSYDYEDFWLKLDSLLKGIGSGSI